MTTMFAALNSVNLGQLGSEPPRLVELIPKGFVRGRDGRSWSNADPQAVLDHFRALNMDLPVDIEHATELKAPHGEAAPAAGWVTGLELRAGAVWGRIDWNASGRELVASRQYRYLSPVILYSKKGGVIAGLTSVALTNRPNLPLQALNHNHLSGDSLENFVPRCDYDAALLRAANAEQKLSQMVQRRIETEIKAGGIKAMNSDERIICERLGVSPEEYLKATI